MRTPPAALSGLVAGLLALGACATETKISNAWTAEKWSGKPLKKVLVIGIAQTDTGRRSFEDHFAAAIRAEGSGAAASYTFLPTDERLTEQQIAGVIRKHGFDSVIVTRLLDVEKETVVVPPSTRMAPSVYGGYGGYYRHYGMGFSMVHDPGYTRTTTIVKMETHLYDAASGDFVWGAHSDTFDPESTDDIIDSVVKAITKRLVKDGVLAGS